jgi:hypothetical protein
MVFVTISVVLLDNNQIVSVELGISWSKVLCWSSCSCFLSIHEHLMILLLFLGKTDFVFLIQFIFLEGIEGQPSACSSRFLGRVSLCEMNYLDCGMISYPSTSS